MFVWTKEHWKEKAETVKNSAKKYFLITKNPIDMKEILVDDGFVPNDVKTVIIGPCNDRPGTTKLGNNQSRKKKLMRLKQSQKLVTQLNLL